MNGKRGATTSVWLAVAAGSLLPFVVGGCAKKTVIAEPPARAFQPPPAFHGEGRPVTEIIPSSGGPVQGPTLVAQQRLSGRTDNGEGVAPTALEQNPGELVAVDLNLKAADFSDVLRILLGGHLDRDFVIDPKVTGPVTLEINGEFTKSELMQVVAHLGTLYGWFIEERDRIVFVRAGDRLAKSADAPILQAAPAIADDQPAVRVRRLKYIGAEQVATLLKDLISENAKALVAGKTIVLADTTRQISRLSRLLTVLDTPAFDGTEVWTYRLGSRKPEDAQKLLETIATGTGMSAAGADQAVAFVAVPGTQRLMVIAKDATLQPMIRELLLQVDQPADGERRQRYVYRVQHYPQSALVKLLSDFFGEKIEAQPGVAAAASTGSEPGSRIRIASDNQSDLLLIHATPTDYADLLATLRAVDRPPQQVVVQSIIAEVNLVNKLEFGVEYFLSGNNSLGELELTGTTPLLNPALATGGAFFIGGDGFAVIQAIDQESETRILSQPKLVMSDRTKGSIQVGGEVPTLKASQGASTQQAGSSDIREEIEYRETGVLLTIEPQISESGLVTLKITQDVTDVVQTAADVANTPSFNTRKLDTTVVVPSGQTVLLGGIIRTNVGKDTNRIPILGRIPVAGPLFGNTDNTGERTELLLAITPTIVNEPAGLAAATSEFLQSVESVRAALLESAEQLPTGSIEQSAPPQPENPLPDRPEKAERAPRL